MAVVTLDDLFAESLKDIYFAAKQILRALPKMIKKAEAKGLRTLLERHRHETEGQIDRLDKVFATIEAKPRGKTCPAIMGIIDESQELISEIEND
jgi:ferritin-like metal-binding protein YciE